VGRVPRGSYCGGRSRGHGMRPKTAAFWVEGIVCPLTRAQNQPIRGWFRVEVIVVAAHAAPECVRRRPRSDKK
jgi:hypothetical protein